MNIIVWTKQPNHFIRKASQRLRAGGHGDECAALLSAQFDGEQVHFERLSVAQFCALEDTAVQLGLKYDATQSAPDPAMLRLHLDEEAGR